mmetsp:Transcript_9110/g.19541  ORF Transcript_9110/g.19541 Transcript_9110/m.19541 type:complete len:377 (-) Transcript_9110:111-1241(-)|eukprot:CAMPEP_0178492140 /NCGR_PEP_ID=MMETSP0696-20121128/11776_1 /TAXON_ID=265572 /ORGANISM="Extubocellulus spinifer, Strain CCMP396" /LENGTH=376 /DNA_ID=CAMNT_0020120039 /DNA_START=262 /DNA_END=1392 /DNA_ORIENTATION=-
MSHSAYKRRLRPASLISTLNVSLYFLQGGGQGVHVGAAASSSLPPNLGDAATYFDVDADWVRIRLGLEDGDSDKRKHGGQKKRRGNKKKGGGPQFPLSLPKISELNLPALRAPQIKLDFKAISDAIFNRKQTSGGTHIRRVADMFDLVLKKSSSSGTQIDSIALIDACKSFLPVMRSFGPEAAAKDFSRNLKKADSLRKHSGRMGRGKKGGDAISRQKKQRKTNRSKKHHQTLSDLLMAEVEAGIHKPGGILKDPSGAVGFLWMRRSIAYQHALFEALTVGAEPRQAAYDAYRSTLMPFHGWAMRRLYTAFLGQCTPETTKEVIAQIAGYDVNDLTPAIEKATIEDLRRLVSTWSPLLTTWKKTHETLDLEDVRRH